MSLADAVAAARALPFDEYCAKLLKCTDKKTCRVPLVFNESQRMLWAGVKEQLSTSGMVRAYDCPKPRQAWHSMMWCALMFWMYWRTPGWNGIVIADELDHSNNLFRYILGFHKSLPTALAPELVHRTEKVLEYKGWDSRIRILTANSPEKAGRSGQVNGVLMTEFPYFRRPEDTFYALLSAVPDTPGTIAVCEGTANGPGYSYEFYKDVKAGKRPGWKLFFTPRYKHHEYQIIDVRDSRWNSVKDIETKDLSDEERKIEDRGAPRSHTRWARYKLASDFGGNRSLFEQEFPADPDSAFITSGVPFFNKPEVLKDRLDDCAPPIEKVTIRCSDISEDPQLVPNEKGSLWIWEHPVKNAKYMGSFDVAGSREGRKRKGSQSVGYMWALNPFRQVAAFEYNPFPTQYARDIRALCLRYNRALAVVERTGIGHSCVLPLSEIYDNVYYMERYDGAKIVIDKVPGYDTNSKTRREMLEQLRQYVDADPFFIRDRRFFEQALTFRDNFGVWEAEQGSLDDHVMCAAIGVQVYRGSKLASGKMSIELSGGSPADSVPSGQIGSLQVRTVGESGQKRKVWYVVTPEMADRRPKPAMQIEGLIDA